MATDKYKAMPDFRQSDIIRFWSKVGKSDPGQCCEWRDAPNYSGYGMFQMRRKTIRAHRVAFFLTTGIDPLGLSVMHTCDNRRCCNPAHLMLGTHQDNMRDKTKKGRDPRGEQCARAWMTEDQVRQLRADFLLRTTSMRQFAKDHGLAYTHLRSIITRETWRHI